MAGRLAGKIALITGGASGLGRAMATLFAAEGAKVAVSDINHAGAQTVAAAIGGNAIAIAQDVTKEAEWQAALAAVHKHFGGLHILVNNAGIGAAGSIAETSLDTWRHVHAVDLDSVFLGCKHGVAAIAETVKAGGRGAIVNISSIAGVIAAPNLAAYNSAKAAVRHLSKSVALYCARNRWPITCNSIHPAFIDTPILNGFATDAPRAAVLEKLGRQIPMGHVGAPDDVAYAALYLGSDEAKFVTGAELYVDGGIAAM
ncbi:MAG: glucose 1-dehydrogenase [Pseudomonadota bacterium]|jgi:NAD(P)-dependent dehydrogenase (short-subunit alcohol dehydrogenase family)